MLVRFRLPRDAKGQFQNKINFIRPSFELLQVALSFSGLGKVDINSHPISQLTLEEAEVE